MQSLNIILTRQYIFYQSSDLSLAETILEINQEDSDILDHFSELLSELSLPRNTNVNLVLDRSFVSYFYFSIPPVSRRKLDKILQFELADILIEDADQYFFDYRFHQIKNVETQIGLYLVKKDLVHQLLQIVKNNSLEMKSILSFNDLLDKNLRAQYTPENEIIVAADWYEANMFVYKNGFLTGFSSQRSLHQQLEESSALQTNNGFKLNQLNWKIKAIGLKENFINNVRISDKSSSYLSLSNQNELFVQTAEKNGVPTTLCTELVSTIQLYRSQNVNLLKSNFFVFQEFKKHIKKIVILLIALGLVGTLYIASLVYNNLQNRQKYQSLEKLYTQTISKYLPKGTSAANALNILKNQVQELKQQRSQNQKFSTRQYQISEQLTELSRLKQEVPSLLLTRYFLTEQSIRIQGEVASFTEYDRLKNNLQNIYPAELVKFSQNSVGDDIIQFTVTIRLDQ